MNRGLVWLACLFVAVLVLPLQTAAQAVPEPPGAAPLDPAGFVREMRRLDPALGEAARKPEEVRSLLAQLPASWQVQTANQQYRISSEPLRTLLAEAQLNAPARQAKLREAQTWAAEMARQAEAYSAERPSTKNPRALAEEILRRPGFTPIRPTSQLDLLRQRINRWVIGMIERFLTSMDRHPIGGEILFWAVIAAVVLFLAVTLFRYWGRHSPVDGLPKQGAIVVTRTWQEWIRSARRAAERGDFREAVHSAYWAAIIYLEIAGIVSPDRARTPREYLRLLESSGTLDAGPGKRRRETLAALTARLERVWYGFRPAGAEDFRDSLQQLEDMGCRLD